MTDDAITAALQRAGVRRAWRQENMARHTSWRIGGPADYLCMVEEEDQLRGAVEIAVSHGLPWLVLGGGNNILVSDAGIEGLVILNRLRGIAIEESDACSVACGAGIFFAKVAHFTAHRGFSGMEWGIAIPGTVGAGIVNNAGAHWSDVSRSLQSATVMDAEGRSERLSPDDLAYRYRQSLLKRFHSTQTRLVVTSCRFRVDRDDSGMAPARLEELRQHRLRTQPVKEPSAGSTFKNPPDQHAGDLIDRAGLKGHRIGDAQIAPLHANFILNLGNGQAADVLALIQVAQKRVNAQFGIRLEPEVQLVGRWSSLALESLMVGAA